MFVLRSYCPIFAENDSSSQQVDEMIFGDGCEILEESGKFFKVKTDYDYVGWCEKSNLGEFKFKPNFRVSLPFADVLPEGRNYFKPILTLPFGAKIWVLESSGERYSRFVAPSGETFFIHNSHITPILQREQKEPLLRDGLVSTAEKYLGVQYRWGGRTPKGVDCSGLCFNAYRFNGVDIWRDAVLERSQNLSQIPFEKAKKGDLLFFKGHVAMYLGDGEIIHASASKGFVLKENLKNNSYLQEIYISTGTLFP